MQESIEYYENKVRKCLEHAGRYTPALDLNIFLLAGALQSVALAYSEISTLTATTETVETSRGKAIRTLPVFKIAREAEENCRKQMKELGLTAEGTRTTSETTPMAELLAAVAGGKGRKVRPGKGG